MLAIVAAEMSKILNYIDQLSEVDVSGVEKSADAALIDRNTLVQSGWHLRNRLSP